MLAAKIVNNLIEYISNYSSNNRSIDDSYIPIIIDTSSIKNIKSLEQNSIKIEKIEKIDFPSIDNILSEIDDLDIMN